ncbi:MAG: IS200/IS605 family transposase [Anaerolineales bacterium]
MPYWQLFYHFVWGTKNGEPLISLEWQASLYNVIAGKAQELGGVVHAVGGMPDHVHLVVSVPPKIALADFVGQIKGNSSHFVNHGLNMQGRFAWQAEYGVVSFSGKSLASVVKYVKDQREHHADDTCIAELERLADNLLLQRKRD